ERRGRRGRGGSEAGGGAPGAREAQPAGEPQASGRALGSSEAWHIDDPEPPPQDEEVDPSAIRAAQEIALRLFAGVEPQQEQKPEGEAKKEAKLEMPKRPAKNRENELLVKVIDGVYPLRIEAQEAAEILTALDIPARYPQLRLVLSGGREAGCLAHELAHAKVPVVLESVVPPALLSDPRVIPVDPANVERLADAGVPLALGTSGTSGLDTRFLLVNAAFAVRHGLDEAKAIDAVTCEAARILGVDGRIGSIEVGKDADIVVFAGHPLGSDGRPDLVLVDGEIVFRRAP
ncbi:MAG: amidohydrolase family protein, partial [Planctomycetota bacterium]